MIIDGGGARSPEDARPLRPFPERIPGRFQASRRGADAVMTSR